MSVISHVDRSKLYPDDDHHGTIYRHMIDGRTIFQYLLFIEPILRRNNPESICFIEPQQNLDGELGESLSFFVLCGGSPPLPHGLEGRQLASLPICGDEVFRAEVRAAVHLLDQVGLSFFLDLGISRIVSAGKEPLLDFDAVFEPGVCATRVLAGNLLRDAALGLFKAWSRAEDGTSACLSKPPADLDVNLLGPIFATSVYIEWLLRCGECEYAANVKRELKAVYFGDASIEAVLDLGTGCPLTRELVAYWLPLWNRAAIIFDSPFDTMSSLTSTRPEAV